MPARPVNIVLHYASEADMLAVCEVERYMERILGKPPEEFGVKVDRRCASAHKTPDYICNVLNDSDADVRGVILGRQAAAPPAIDANCIEPVVTYLTDGKDNPAKVYGSLDVPSGVSCMTVSPHGPEHMALALLKIAAIKENRLNIPIHDYQIKKRQDVLETDARYKGLSTTEAENIAKVRLKK